MLVVTTYKPEHKVKMWVDARDQGGVWKRVRRESAACVLATPRGLLDAVVGILLARPVRDFVDREHTTFGPHDLVRQVRREIGKYNAGGFVILDEEGFIQGVITRLSFLGRSAFRVALVDHNEFSQGVEGLEEAEVVEVIDHHRLGGRSTDTPVTFINRVVGSTCTIVADLYRAAGCRPDQDTAGLLLSGVLSDTVILKSPTTTDVDREIVAWLSGIAGVDAREYGRRMFSAGSLLEGMDPAAIVTQDQKVYEQERWKFSVSQVEVVGFAEAMELRSALLEELSRQVDRRGLGFSCLMVTDITGESSLLLCAGPRRLLDAITYPRVEEDLFEMKGVLSRKKQLLPYLLELIRGL